MIVSLSFCSPRTAFFSKEDTPFHTFLRRIKHFLPDLYEVAAKKSEIFSLPLHTNQVKNVLSFIVKTLGCLIRR
jgi:hypothetical protein